MNTKYTSERIDSTAFRRGIRAFKTGKSNPYNGPELRDEWDAGRAYAAHKAEMPRAIAAVDATYCHEYMADAAIQYEWFDRDGERHVTDLRPNPCETPLRVLAIAKATEVKP